MSVLEHIACFGADDGFNPREKGKPTEHMPGTWARVEVFAKRVQLGQDLWNPDDAVDDDRKPGEDSLFVGALAELLGNVE